MKGVQDRRALELTVQPPGGESDKDDEEDLVESALNSGYFVLVEHALDAMDRKVGTIGGFLNTTEGRDKIFKITQYGVRSFCYWFGSRMLEEETEKRMLSLASSCSLTRKFLKLGMQLAIGRLVIRVFSSDVWGRYRDLLETGGYYNPRLSMVDLKKMHPLKRQMSMRRGVLDYNWRRHVKALTTMVTEPKMWLKYLAVGRLSGLFAYFSFDNVIWAIKVKLLYNQDKRKWLRRALLGHVISCFCAMWLNIYQAVKNWRRLLHIRRQLEEHNKILEENIGDYDLGKDSQHWKKQEWLKHHLESVHQKMHNLRVTSFKLLLDVIVSGDVVFQVGLNKKYSALLSLTSALMATRQLWKRIESGKYNPTKIASNLKKSPRLPKDLEPSETYWDFRRISGNVSGSANGRSAAQKKKQKKNGKSSSESRRASKNSRKKQG